jgi:DUF4097 and DUF4098 domain-containing protein YvlB
MLSLPALAAVTGHFDRTLQVSGHVQLDVKTGSGNIRVRKGEAGSVRVYGTIRAGESFFGGGDPSAKVRRLEQNPPIEQTGNIIRIGHISDYDLRQNVSISYEIVVPAETQVAAEAGSGEIDAEGVKGPAKLHTGSGNLTAANIGSTLDAHTGSGDMNLTNISGDLVAHAGSGQIKGESLAGADLETGSGDIRVAGVKGRVRAHTGSGDVNIEGNATSDWFVETGSGSVTLRLPSNAGFDFSAQTGSGSINTEQPLTISGTQSRHELRGKVRGGGPRVEVHTGSGDVRLL